jgi:hypothetical protein
MSRFSLVLIKVAACLLLSCSALAGQEANDKAAASARMAMTQMDFSSALAGYECTTFQDLNSTSQGPFDEYLKALQREYVKSFDQSQLTHKDLRYLGVWRFPSGRYANVFRTFSVLKRFYQEHGRLPSDGIEAMQDLLPVSGPGSFFNSSVDEQLNRCFSMINPITGRFHETFEAQVWAPGAMSIEIVKDPPSGSTKYSSYFVPVDPSGELGHEFRPATEVWVITVYGENPDTILWVYEWPI